MENTNGLGQEYKKNKKYLVVVVLFLVIGIGGYIGYKSYISKPEVILSKVLDAYDKKNISEFEKLVEVDDFSYVMWNDYKDWKEKNRDCLWWPIRDNIDSADSVKLMLRNAVDGKKTLGDFEKLDDGSGTTVSMASMIDKMHDWKISSVSDNGDVKKFRVAAKTYDEKEFTFDFTMENKNGAWKITRLNNMGEICTIFEEFAKESLISYLKNSQEIQDEYFSKNKEAYKLRGDEIYKALRDNENEHATKLLDFPTNPFSNVLNLNRVACSQFKCKYYDIILQMKTTKDKDMLTDLIKEKDRNYKKSEDYKNRVEWVIKRVGYEEK